MFHFDLSEIGDQTLNLIQSSVFVNNFELRNAQRRHFANHFRVIRNLVMIDFWIFLSLCELLITEKFTLLFDNLKQLLCDVELFIYLFQDAIVRHLGVLFALLFSVYQKVVKSLEKFRTLSFRCLQILRNFVFLCL